MQLSSHLLEFIFFLLSLVSTNPSAEAKSLPCMFFVDATVSNYFCRMSMINRADPSFGVPETIISDSETQFTSHEFREFCKANTINHILSPPYHPQSIGRAERFVNTFNRGLLRLRVEGDVDKILDTFLLAYRMTPSSTLPQCCPAELFFGCKPQTTLDLLPTKQPMGHDIKNGMPIQQLTWSSCTQL